MSDWPELERRARPRHVGAAAPRRADARQDPRRPCPVDQPRLARRAAAEGRTGWRLCRPPRATAAPSRWCSTSAATRSCCGSATNRATSCRSTPGASRRFIRGWSPCSTATACRRPSTARRARSRTRCRSPRTRRRATYDRDSADRLREALAAMLPVFDRFRAGFTGKASPVHFWWGGFDLAVTRFSGRTAPPHPGGIPGLPDRITREAYSDEVSSAGFWAGGVTAAEPFFYSYAYPEPAGYRDRQVAPGRVRRDTMASSSCPMPRCAPRAIPSGMLGEFPAIDLRCRRRPRELGPRARSSASRSRPRRRRTGRAKSSSGSRRPPASARPAAVAR